MSTFRAPVTRVRALEPIEGADSIELAVVGDFRSVVRKGELSPGDLVGYMPEAALVPEWLLRRLNLWNEELGIGRLSGSAGDRVGPKRLRGTISEGVVVPLRLGPSGPVLELRDGEAPVREGDDVAPLLGLEKFVPPIPDDLLGKVADLSGHTKGFDVENRKAFPDVIREGEPVAYTEKVHGVFCAVGVVPGLAMPGLFHGGEVYVASKLLHAQGLVFQDAEENAGNLYVRALRSLDASVRGLQSVARGLGEPVHVLGEIYGHGVQKRFAYGLKHAVGFRSFDVFVGTPTRGRYMDFEEKRDFAAGLGFGLVDVLYRGPHSMAEMLRHRDGASVTGGGANIREGLVICPLVERRDPALGRVLLKEISPAYLGKTDGTELS